jgi:cell division protein FtsZ
MERREFIIQLGNAALGSLIAPNLLTRLMVRSYGVHPLPFDDTSARITAIGIGPRGAQMTQILARNVSGIDCHHVLFSPTTGNPEDLSSVLSAARRSDLLFLLAGLEEAHQDILLQGIGDVARGCGVLTVAVTPGIGDWRSMDPEEVDRINRSVDCLFSASATSLSALNEFSAQPKNWHTLSGYAMRHTVATICSLVTQRGIICIDFADIAAILQLGMVGRLGTGVSADPFRGRTAALSAIDRLAFQGGDISKAKGIIACVHGSSDMSMEDFDEASGAIHEHAHEDVNIIIGILTEEQLGTNIKVSILMLA